MAACEKCWSDAFSRSRLTGRSQAECYRELLTERDAAGVICTTDTEGQD